ncbi:DUF2463 domain-containing protein [Encephalitozoon hellem]|uniref:DUF2463 domain-containing protein n=1 Tax=Encephalitozoon hellem TaxID=27973 RepID=A0ABY8CIQ5_ENCHE|nr:DUF2463 domain-containing protein [Encephalitozoon hellem]WEL37980.1 DUF2463 domain-containing protein [Encephalitozoon hellem]WEL38723.1 DUF2463 domain-containing protein [Encephalitozoon hellem]
MNAAHTHHEHPSQNTHATTEQSHTHLLRQYTPTISILIPLILTILHQNYIIRDSMLLRLITVLPPCIYSGIQYLILFSNIKHHASKSVLHSLLALAFVSFSVILFICATILLAYYEWSQEDFYSFSTIFSPLLILPPYLLSTSCGLAHNNFQYTSTDSIDILLDLLILLAIPSRIAILELNKNTSQNSPQRPIYSTTVFAALLFTRSYTESHPPSAKFMPLLSLWRLFALLSLLLITAASYATIVYSYTLREESKALCFS